MIRYRYAGPAHRICKGRLPIEAKGDFHVLPELAHPCAILATDGNRNIVGFMRFTTTYNNRRLYAAGTWVSEKCRGCGIAAQMWRRVLHRIEPKFVEVRTISEGGRRLVGRVVQDADTEIIWKVTA